MAQPLLNLQYETPQDVQQRLRMQYLAGLRSQTSDYGQFGYALASAFGGPSPEVARAEELQRRIQTAEAAAQADAVAEAGYPESGTVQEDQITAEMRRLNKIRSSIGDVAPELLPQIDNQMLQLEQVRIERAKLFAEEQRAAAESESKLTGAGVNLQQDLADAVTYHNPETGEQQSFLKTDLRGISNAIRSGWIQGADPRRATETGAAATLSKPTRTKLEAAIIAADNMLDQMASTGAKWDERWLQYKPQVLMSAANELEKFGVKPSAQVAGDIKRYNEFRASAIRTLNNYIQQITGAAMGKEEEVRIRKGVPDPEKDGPTQFLSKARTTVREILGVRKRASDALANGITALEDIERLATPAVSDAEVDAFMQKAFGVASGNSAAQGGAVRRSKSGVQYTVE